MKMPFNVTVNNEAYSLFVKALKNSLNSFKSNCNDMQHGLRKIEHRKGLTKQ